MGIVIPKGIATRNASHELRTAVGRQLSTISLVDIVRSHQPISSLLLRTRLDGDTQVFNVPLSLIAYLDRLRYKSKISHGELHGAAPPTLAEWGSLFVYGVVDPSPPVALTGADSSFAYERGKNYHLTELIGVGLPVAQSRILRIVHKALGIHQLYTLLYK